MSLRTKSVLGTIGTCSVLAASALLATAAQADTRPDQTTVHLGDLRLDRPADVAVMYQRINLAAEQVCRQRALNGSDVISPAHAHCVADTVEKVVASINRAPLTAFSRQQKQMLVASAAPL
jgi:UrcA family protein